MTEIHIGMIQGRHEIDDILDGYIWGEHLIGEGIMEWGENPHTGEKVLKLIDPDDTSTHRRVAGEWITENVLSHPLLIGADMAHSYTQGKYEWKVTVIFYITGGMTQLVCDFSTVWKDLILNPFQTRIHPTFDGLEINLERATYHPETKTYTRRDWL